jgi:hypothetical protein
MEHNRSMEIIEAFMDHFLQPVFHFLELKHESTQQAIYSEVLNPFSLKPISDNVFHARETIHLSPLPWRRFRKSAYEASNPSSDVPSPSTP